MTVTVLQSPALLQDVTLLHRKLPNSEYHEIALPEFNHFDFMWAIDVKTLVNDKVISLLKVDNNPEL
jgi:hypothetical protein